MAMWIRAFCVFLILPQAAHAAEPSILTRLDDPELAKHLFYGNGRSATAHARKFTSEGEPIYNATYSTDSLRRRINPYNPKNGTTRQLLFVGCSDTFGEGLNDDEAIPSQISLLTKNTHAYNYGVQGYGPGNVLSYLKYGRISEHFADPGKVELVYLWGDHLFERATGSLFHLSWGASTTPYYYVKGDHVEFGGSFADAYPFRTMLARVLYRTPLLGPALYKKVMFRDLPDSLSGAKLELNLRIVLDTFAEYKRQFKNDRFYVALLPGSNFDRERLWKPLEQSGVKIVDMVSLYRDEKNPERFQLKQDGHPSAAGARLMAQALIKALNLK